MDIYKNMLDDKFQVSNLEQQLVDASISLEEATKTLEAGIVETARLCQTAGASCEPPAPAAVALDKEIKDLIQERRHLGHQGAVRVSISKTIAKKTRQLLKLKRDSKIDELLSEFRGLKEIANIRNNGKRKLLSSVRNKAGVLEESRQGIVDVFADFYAELYESKHADKDRHFISKDVSKVPEFSLEELKSQLKVMAKGKAADKTGLVIEMLSSAGDGLLRCVAHLFTEVANGREAPASWKKSNLSVLFKAGDCRLPENYRPLAMLPILYKLFSKVLWSRVRGVLDSAQTVDQAGFRSKFSCEDHLLAAVLVAEAMNEFRSPLWIAAIDYRKAFDCVEHNALWEALLAQGVQPAYVRILEGLYHQQHGCVVADRISKSFSMARGTKQGDPISPALFNSVLEFAMKDAVCKWRARGWGIRFSSASEDLLCTLRFADDVLLLASSRKQLKIMIGDLMAAVGRVGLQIHAGKTKVLVNSVGRAGGVGRILSVEGHALEVLAHDAGTKYLGRLLNIDSDTGLHDMEIDNRIASAWRKFGAKKSELTSQKFALRARLRLFDSTVSPCLLYGAGAWTLNEERKAKLRTTQRTMLRLIVGCRRKRIAQENSDLSSLDTQSMSAVESLEPELENWIDFIVRSTHIAEAMSTRFKVRDWVTEHFRFRFRLAGHVSRREDRRWSHVH